MICSTSGPICSTSASSLTCGVSSSTQFHRKFKLYSIHAGSSSCSSGTPFHRKPKLYSTYACGSSSSTPLTASLCTLLQRVIQQYIKGVPREEFQKLDSKLGRLINNIKQEKTEQLQFERLRSHYSSIYEEMFATPTCHCVSPF